MVADVGKEEGETMWAECGVRGEVKDVGVYQS